MNLSVAEEGKEYIIQRIETDDEDRNAFLFSLGCPDSKTCSGQCAHCSGCCNGAGNQP